MEHELPELGKGVCEPAGVLEPRTGTDVVRDGEARDSKIFESGKCTDVSSLADFVLICLHGPIEEGSTQVRGFVVLLLVLGMMLIVLPRVGV